MSRGGQILKNFQINILFTMITSLLNFVINSYFLKRMGVDLLGLSKLFTQFIAYLSLADLGLGTASSYALYKPLAEKNYRRIDVVFSTLESFYRRISFFICVLGVGASFFLPYLIPDEKFGKKIYFYWGLYIINTAITYLYAKYNILFLANQEYKYSRIIMGSSTILSQICQLGIVLYIQSFSLYIFTMILTGLLTLALFKIHYRKNYSYIEKTSERDRQIGKDMGKLFFQKVGDLIVFNTDYIVLSIFESLALIGIYSSYLVIYNAMVVFTSMILNVITPQIGQYIAEKNRIEIYDLWKEFYSFFIFLAAVLVFTTGYLIQKFIVLWIGERYLLSNLTVLFIMINLFINISRTVTEAFKNSSGYFSDIQTPFLEGAINLTVSLVLVKPLGIDGVIIGTIASNVVIVLFLKPYLVFHHCFNRAFRDYLREFLKFISLTALGTGISWMAVRSLFPLSHAESWAGWIWTGGGTFFTTFILCFAIFMTTSEFRRNISRFTYLISKRRKV